MVDFEQFTFIDGGACAAKGFVAGGMHAGINKNPAKPDLAVIACETVCNTAALYTTNKVQGAPLLVTKQHLQNHKAQAVVINSGNANTCNANGVEIAELMCSLTADALHIAIDDVLVASTGVIGKPLTDAPFIRAIPELCGNLRKDGSHDACAAIMTTDTTKKEYAVSFSLGGTECHIGGIAKGSGMIKPNMATMLAFITTDVCISSALLHKALTAVNRLTFNRVCVDGDTSTNDMVSLMASGLAGNAEINEENADYKLFVDGLYAVMLNLARDMAKDGEGATKLIECVVVHAPDEQTAEAVAKSVIASSLLKTAMFAADANWGRILCAIGYAEAEFSIDAVSVILSSSAGSVKVCEQGAGVPFSEEEAKRVLSEDEITILVDLHTEGIGEAVAWGCDLTYDYIKINADYRT